MVRQGLLGIGIHLVVLKGSVLLEVTKLSIQVSLPKHNCQGCSKLYLDSTFAVTKPGFSRGGGANPTLGGQGGLQHTILANFPKNCMTFKEFGPRGARPSRPLRSATVLDRIIFWFASLEYSSFLNVIVSWLCLKHHISAALRYRTSIGYIEMSSLRSKIFGGDRWMTFILFPSIS